jgi:hypothetical protein
VKLQRQALDIVLPIPRWRRRILVGASGFNASVNQGACSSASSRCRARRPHHPARRRPLAPGAGAHRGHQRLHDRLAGHRVGARQGRSQYQLTFWSPEFDTLYAWVPKIVSG